jgi:uncharacterized protein YfkK (UPF0435 family)
MDSKQVINEEYKVLCQRRGHLITNREKLDKELADIAARIEVLNETIVVVEQVEKVTREALAKATNVKKRLDEE